MNKLLTFGGGQPLVTGDLDFLQECYAGVLEALGKALSQDVDCVLYGVDGESSDRLSAGAVCIGGEVLLVPSPLALTSERYLCFRQTDQEEREFADAQSHKVHRVVEPYVSNTTEGAYRYMEIAGRKRLADVLSGEAFWQDMTSVTFPSGVTGRVESNERLKYHRITLSKSAGEDNLLFNYPSTSAHNPLTGLAVDTDTNKAYVVKMSIGACRVYNADGTPYNGTLSFTNVIIK